MMQVKTKAYGVVELDERHVIHFPTGMFGFETLHEYILMDARQQPFYWLQSLEVEQVAFVLIKPNVFREDYLPAVVKSELQSLDLKTEKDEDALVFSIVTFHEDDQSMTANLQGPILINRSKRVGKQCISIDSRWKTRHNIAEELAARKDTVC